MKAPIKARTSLLALALLLGGCAATASSPPQQAAATSGVNAADADAFVAAAKKDLFDFSVFNARVQWINNTYITEDGDAVAARIGAEDTEMSVRLAKEAARFDKTPGLSVDTRRKLGILKQGIVLPAPSTPGAAAELNTIDPRLQATYGKGMGTLDGKPITGQDYAKKQGMKKEPRA